MSPRLSIICIWFCFIILLVLGIMMVASTGLCAYVPNGGSPAQFLIKQCIFAFLGLLLALAISAINYQKIRPWVNVIWVVCVIMLICCYLPVIGMTINGEQRWVNLGFMSFQPSEVAKICLMISLADWYTTHREMPGSFSEALCGPAPSFSGCPWRSSSLRKTWVRQRRWLSPAGV